MRRPDRINPWRWIGTFQFLWLGLMACRLFGVIEWPWALLLSPIWLPFALLVTVELVLAFASWRLKREAIKHWMTRS